MRLLHWSQEVPSRDPSRSIAAQKALVEAALHMIMEQVDGCHYGPGHFAALFSCIITLSSHQNHPLLSRRAGANFIRVLPLVSLAPLLVPVGDVVWPGFARMALLSSVEMGGF